MNKFSPKLIIPVAALAVVVAGTYGITQAKADSSTGDPLVQKIADTFHLDKSKVQAVLDQNHADRQKQMEANYEDRLTQAVKDGQLTQTQKDAVLAEHNQLKTEMDAARSSSETDRHSKMEQIRTEAENWAKQNNIDIKWLMPGPHGHMGPMGGHHMMSQ
jgi:hypothetical protein